MVKCDNPDELRKLANDDVLFLEAHGFDADLLGKTQRRILAAADAWDDDLDMVVSLTRMLDGATARVEALRKRLESVEKATIKCDLGRLADFVAANPSNRAEGWEWDEDIRALAAALKEANDG